MRIIINDILPFGKKFAAINLMGVLFVKSGVKVTPQLINHERIHSAQLREMLYIPFYIAYVAEWLFRLISCRGDGYRAYRALSFEREAYTHGDDLTYLRRRSRFAQYRRPTR